MSKNSLRVFIKDQHSVHKMFHIRRQKNTLVGWMNPTSWHHLDLGVPEGSPIDLHFTYPSDGNYHFSYKPKNEETGESDAIRVYHDRIEHVFARSLNREIETRHRDDHDSQWQFLAPRFKAPSFAEFEMEDKAFAFPTVGFNIGEGRFLPPALSELSSYEKRMENHEIVDVSGLGTGALNIIGSLSGKGSAPLWDSDPHKIWSINDKSAYPHITISVLFMPT